MKKMWLAGLICLGLLLVACSPESVVEIVEVTRTVSMTEQVVEVVEVTRVVGADDVAGLQPADQFFADYGVNPFVATGVDNLSTFSLDVDTGAYTVMRNYLERQQLPPAASVRIEEYINYFDQAYDLPAAGGFALDLEAAPAPYGENERSYLVRIGVQGYEVAEAARPDALLIFVVDVSGSMSAADRLPLVKQSLSYLVANLRDNDRVAIVTYGDRAEIHLQPTAAHQRGDLLRAIDSMAITGSTNVEAGLQLAYGLAEDYAVAGQINRLVLLSDGAANVGATFAESILQHAEAGIALSTFGFGMDSYNDTLMEQLADQGDGSYAYIDTIDEAVRVFDTQLTTTLLTIAKDAKIQVEFNPDVISEYRLLGYENRAVADADFTNDEVDAGEIGAGHQATALYEVQLVPGADLSATALSVHLRYLEPASEEAVTLQVSLSPADFAPSFAAASPTFQLSAVVAQYAEVLRESYWAEGSDLDQMAGDLLRVGGLLADDQNVREFVQLMLTALDLLR